MGKTIGIVSLKGGVGKTSVVAALGAALADLDKKILLIDGNLSSPTLGLHLNIVDTEKTLHHVLNRTANTKEAIYQYENFDVMPSSAFERIETNPLKLKDKIKGLKKKYDFILMDSSPTLDHETLAVILASDEIFVVTTPDHPTLNSTLKSIKLARQRGTPISGLILNKVHKKDFEVALEDIEGVANIPVMAVIPYDTNVLKALSELIPSTHHKPHSEGSTEYKKLAATLTGKKYKQVRLRDFFRKLVPKKQEVNRELFYKGVFK